MKAIIQKHPVTGNVITEAQDKNDNTYGKIMVKSTELVVNSGGHLTPQNRAAFIPIGADSLEQVRGFLKEGMEVPFAGRIQRTESFSPIYAGHKAKVIPADAKAGTPEREYKLDGQSVYFTDEWNSDVNCLDTLLVSTEASVEVNEGASAEAGA